MRIGLGYDVHRFASNRPLILGGVHIPFSKGLLGHSDADVLVHAISDAFLGSLNLGDIGVFFPDTNPKFKNADSLFFLKEIYQKIQHQGYQLNNLDTVILAEAPKMRPFIHEMQHNIANALQTETNLISIKATTTEQLGFIGREEGIAAKAVVLITQKKYDSHHHSS